MKHCLLLTYLTLFAALCYGQTPQYSVNATSGANTYPFNNTSGNKVGWLYVPGDFGTPPAGTITDIYFRTAGAATNASYTNFTIKMGLTSNTGWPSTTYPTTGMTTVVSGNPYVIPSVPSGWVKFTLTTPFIFDGTSSIMVLVESQSYSNGFNVYQNSLSSRRIYGTYGSATANGMDGTYAGFGFDIQTCPNPSFSSQPINSNICEGANTNFSVTATDASFYQWQVNTGSGFANVTNGGVYSGATTNTLSLNTVPASYDAYQYRCIVTGACSNPVNTSVAMLTVMPGAAITKQTAADSVCETAPTSMSVWTYGTISGYQWQMAVSTVGVYSDIPNAFPFSGTTSSTLDILNTHDSLNGYLFRCIISSTGSCGGATSGPIPLTVLVPPVITSDGPETAMIQPNADAAFSIKVDGHNYGTYWQASSDGVNFSNINDNALYKNTKTSTLLVKAAPLSMANWWFRAIIKSTDPDCGIYRDTSEAAQLVMVDPNSVSGLTKNETIILSPNPVSGSEIFIGNPGTGKTMQVAVVDNLGKTVIATRLELTAHDNTPLDIASLPAGIYIMRLRDETGAMINFRFTKQ